MTNLTIQPNDTQINIDDLVYFNQYAGATGFRSFLSAENARFQRNSYGFREKFNKFVRNIPTLAFSQIPDKITQAADWQFFDFGIKLYGRNYGHPRDVNLSEETGTTQQFGITSTTTNTGRFNTGRINPAQAVPDLPTVQTYRLTDSTIPSEYNSRLAQGQSPVILTDIDRLRVVKLWEFSSCLGVASPAAIDRMLLAVFPPVPASGVKSYIEVVRGGASILHLPSNTNFQLKLYLAQYSVIIQRTMDSTGADSFGNLTPMQIIYDAGASL